MLASSYVVGRFRAAIEAQAGTKPVFRTRSRAIASDVPEAFIVRLGLARGELYTQGGSIEWDIDVVVSGFARVLPGVGDPDAVSDALLEIAHNALIADMTLGDAHLSLNPAFTMSQDEDEQDELLSASTAIYNVKLTTSNSHADAP